MILHMNWQMIFCNEIAFHRQICCRDLKIISGCVRWKILLIIKSRWPWKSRFFTSVLLLEKHLLLNGEKWKIQIMQRSFFYTVLDIRESLLFYVECIFHIQTFSYELDGPNILCIILIDLCNHFIRLLVYENMRITIW